MKYCHQCGNRLTLGTETYCPSCGTKQIPAIESGGSNSASTRTSTATDITGTSGDVIGSTTSGMGNIIGKEVAYSVQGSVINLQVESISTQTLQQLKDIISQPLQIALTDNSDVQLNSLRANEAKANKEGTSQVLKDIDQIGKEKGTHIEHIRAGEVQVSRTELMLRDAILEGIEHHYKGEYLVAIEHYDAALKMDNRNGKAWGNKALALESLGKYDEAILCYDITLEIDSEDAKAWYNKGNAFRKLGMYDEAIKSHNKALEIGRKHLSLYVSNNINKGITLGIQSNYDEAIKCFDKALEIERNDDDAWNNKGFALSNLHRYTEAIQCYDMALKIDSKKASTWNNKGNTLRELGKIKEAEECYKIAKKLG